MFIEIPATKSSISRRKPLYGVGINDADYVVQPTVRGKRYICSYYKVWHSMVVRCYSLNQRNDNPSYIDCSICNEWLIFSNFRSWMQVQKWEDKALDKDIISPGNKTYSPDLCCFVTQQINNLLFDNRSTRGEYPQGVSYREKSNKYEVQMNISGRPNFLGSFNTPEAASAAYIKAKTDHIIEIAQEQSDPRIKKGLMLHAELMLKEFN